MADITWEPPGAGEWTLDLSHCLGSMTPIAQDVQSMGCTAGMRTLFAEYGMPLETLDARFVNGYFYTRLRPLIAPERASSKAPPAFLLKLAFKLHPELRRRSKRAEHTIVAKPWRAAIRHWDESERAQFEAENLALQDVDVATLDDAGLARHYGDVLAATRRGYERHFVLHGYDLGPIGFLLVACERWDIAADEVVPALQGASPSTSEPAHILARLRELIIASGTEPTSLDQLRDMSPEVAGELDRYLRYRGMQVFSRYDIDGVTLAEIPDVLLATILQGREAIGTNDPDTIASGLRARVPEAERAEFDELLSEARFAMNLRDDNGPTTAEWRLGLLRRVVLEAGRRWEASGRVRDAADAFELRPDEVQPVLTGSATPTADELAARASHRAHLSTVTPPTTLGRPEAAPPTSALPKATATLVAVVETVLALLATQDRHDDLAGTGVGTTRHRGRVRTARSPEEAIATLEPGEVLVVPFTTPAYNTVLPLAGAIVTTQGGPLCHAAVLARELGIPAVVGAVGALTRLHDGAEVEVDPVAGQVRVLADVAPSI